MIEIRRILCPTDFSAFSRLALEHATAIARWYGAEIEALHVVPPAPAVWAMPPDLNPVALETAVCERAREELEAFVAQPRAAGVACRSDVVCGVEAAEIVRRSREWPAQLVVMGTHGRGGFEHWVLGSVAEKVLRKACCPVLTVTERGSSHAPAHAPFRRILCPVDFSEASRTALRYALSLAQESNARLLQLHVLEPAALAAAPDLSPPDPADLAGALSRRMRAEIPEAARDWCELDERVVRGKAWTAIAEVARAERADLIAIGVQGRGAIDLMVFGSTAHHVIREGIAPVLTIRAA